MEAQARWSTTDDYFQSYYRDWIRDVSKGRKWSIPIGIALIVIGAVLLSTDYGRRHDNAFISYGIFVFGLYQLFWYFREKRRWFQVMKQGASSGGELTMAFSPAGIEHSGPTSSGTVTWEAIEAVIPSRSGLFLRLQKGISIYVPNAAFKEVDGPSRVLNLFEQHSS